MIEGFRLLADHIPAPDQKRLVEDVLQCVVEAPFFRPTMPRSGKPMSVQMTNLGPLGWVSDISGYRYDRLHPKTGRPWPPMPQRLLDLWRAVSGYGADPQACLVNYYFPVSRLGLHVDADETARNAPVVSVSLGDRALFRLGGRAGQTLLHLCAWRREMWWFWVERPGEPITASTAFTRVHPVLFRTADASTSRSGE